MFPAQSTRLFSSVFFLYSMILLQYGISFAQKGNEPMHITDLLQVKAITGVKTSNEGKRAAFRESPSSYVQYVTTPLIIFHGENDLRTGIASGEQFYKSLKIQGKPVEYVRHPGATHEITRSGNNRQRIDQMTRTWEFFERYTGTEMKK
jgi:dipeptidyl aminopeptidase/acylaminoacyl peptidase